MLPFILVLLLSYILNLCYNRFNEAFLNACIWYLLSCLVLLVLSCLVRVCPYLCLVFYVGLVSSYRLCCLSFFPCCVFTWLVLHRHLSGLCPSIFVFCLLSGPCLFLSCVVCPSLRGTCVLCSP